MKSIKFLFVLLASCTVPSCAVYSIYNLSLSSVESPVNAKERWGETKISHVFHGGLEKYCYEDDYIKIFWYVGSTQIGFDLTNKSLYTMKINWNEMVYIDENGRAERIMHTGVKYVDRNESQPHTIIPKNSTIVDSVIPTKNISYDNTNTILFGSSGKWVEAPLFPTFYSKDEVLESGMLGKRVKIVFPIIIQDITNEYTFEFKIDDIVEPVSN